MSDSLINEVSIVTEYLTRAQDALLDVRAARTSDDLEAALWTLAKWAEGTSRAAERARGLVGQFQPDNKPKEES